MKRNRTNPDWRCARCLRKPPYTARRGNSPVCVVCRDELTARGQRWCVGCNAPLPVARFRQQGAQCHRCRQPAAYVQLKRWRERYPEKHRAIQRRWRAAHPEQIRRMRHETYRRRVVRLWRQSIPR